MHKNPISKPYDVVSQYRSFIIFQAFKVTMLQGFLHAKSEVQLGTESYNKAINHMEILNLKMSSLITMAVMLPRKM